MKTAPLGEDKMGEPIASQIDLPIEVEDNSAVERSPGLGWTLSDETMDTIREIDANIRAAEQVSGTLILG